MSVCSALALAFSRPHPPRTISSHSSSCTCSTHFTHFERRELLLCDSQKQDGVNERDCVGSVQASISKKDAAILCPSQGYMAVEE